MKNTVMRGGLWKNTEDEVLKAALMKYGNNEWGRISSLVGRKSAKLCKARLYEWLHPSIKKIEWSIEEDEKLLHLAKVVPAQWRTMSAIIVGRTPSQCLERYDKLVDSAALVGEDENWDDPRKLIDPNPESKPCRPDAVDIEDADKGMLSEARARFANTKGKKSKRKAREKLLEEGRRQACVQKTRELKAAAADGFVFNSRKRKRDGGIDYNAEIPFEKKPPLGFYDVADEASDQQHHSYPISFEELEGEKRCDREARLRKQDLGRRNNKIAAAAANSCLVNNNYDDHMETATAQKNRSKLMLPPPQNEIIARNQLELPRQSAESRRDLRSKLTSLPHPMNVTSL